MREDEIAEAQKLESIELRKKQEIERRKQQHKVKKLEKIAAHKKFVCRQVAKKFFAPLTSHALVSLEERGAMVQDFDVEICENFLPWLMGKTHEFLIDEEVHEKNNDKLLRDVMRIEELGHRSMMEKEHKRQDNQRAAAEKAHQQKLNEKEQRRLEKERKKKEEELRKLKEDINQKFIQTGESAEGIAFQEVSTPNADFIEKKIVGAVGGPFTQMAIVLSTIKEREEEYDEFYNRKNIAQFLITYVISAMKAEQFSILVDKHVENFLAENDQSMDDFTRLTGNTAKAFRDLMKDREKGMLNKTFRFVNSVAKDCGINLDVFQMVHDVLADVLTRKPKAKEGVETKQDQFLKRVKIQTLPEDHKQGEDSVKAIVKINIPMVEKKKDGSDEESDEEDEGDKENNDGPKKDVEMVEAPLEDKIQLVNPKGQDYNIMVLHQAGGRVFRREIANSLKKLMPIFEDIDVDEVSTAAEEISNKLEQKWIASQGHHVFKFEIN